MLQIQGHIEQRLYHVATVSLAKLNKKSKNLKSTSDNSSYPTPSLKTLRPNLLRRLRVTANVVRNREAKMDKQNQLLRLFKLIQQIDINNKLEDGKFIFKQQTRKVIKNEIDRLSTIVQQSLSGSDDKSSSPKSCRTCCHNYEDDTKPPCANCFGFVNWERHDF